ncbi:MAG: hypothetical protein J2O48_08425 [Solirubrobacterales bacterium]|nr:hypothetical protein [Solirubrobacterales bacterium]
MSGSAEPNPDEPVACELTPGDHRKQSQRWAGLVRDAGLSQERTPDGILLRFRADPAVERELEALVAVENECCGWARWQVRNDRDAVVMQASASGYGIQTLHQMLDRSAG